MSALEIDVLLTPSPSLQDSLESTATISVTLLGPPGPQGPEPTVIDGGTPNDTSGA